MDPQLIVTVAAAVTIIGGIFAAIKWGRGALVKIWHFISRYKPRVPRETVRILPQTYGCRWSKGTVDGKPAMHLMGKWHVTNITGDPAYLLRARIVRPSTEGHVLTQHPNQNIFGDHPILPGQTKEVISDFWILHPVRKVGQDLKATVVLTDQYGNDHKIRNIVFKGERPKQPEGMDPPFELIHTIVNPVEKEIVAVLQDEVNRYKNCGRRVGGLGSVQTIVNGRTYRGIGTEWREADSPKNQSIYEEESEITIISDNVQALMNLHMRLSDEKEQQIFKDALLSRIDKNGAYASVGYFIFYIFFNLGMLHQALDKARDDLAGDGAHGFSDLLRLLDGLLRFRHTSFSSETLDHVERFANGVDEHVFRIRERVAAIRAYRLATQKNNENTV